MIKTCWRQLARWLAGMGPTSRAVLCALISMLFLRIDCPEGPHQLPPVIISDVLIAQYITCDVVWSNACQWKMTVPLEDTIAANWHAYVVAVKADGSYQDSWYTSIPQPQKDGTSHQYVLDWSNSWCISADSVDTTYSVYIDVFATVSQRCTCMAVVGPQWKNSTTIVRSDGAYHLEKWIGDRMYAGSGDSLSWYWAYPLFARAVDNVCGAGRNNKGIVWSTNSSKVIVVQPDALTRTFKDIVGSETSIRGLGVPPV
jgi:hypothetical protein